MSSRIVMALACGVLACAALAQPASAPANGVRTQRFADVALHPQREAPATVVPRNEARLAAEVAGRVLRWTADTGARVARGALLVELDPTDLRLARDQAKAALDASRARLALAQAQLARARELVAQNFFSKEALGARETEVELARTEVEANRAQLASAERALAKTRIHAPFDAAVRERLAQAGEYVNPGTPLYVLTQTTGAEVSAQVTLADVDSVRASDALTFVSGAGRVPLALSRVSPTVSVPARTVEVRLEPRQPVVIGAQGQLVWREVQPHVPASLLVRRDGRLGVFVVEQGKARFVPLPRAQEGRATPADLPADARLVTAGQAALQDGQPAAAGP
jgi:RND family efflux transporter MFP subunit